MAIAQNGSLVFATGENGLYKSDSEATAFEQTGPSAFIEAVIRRPSGSLLATFSNEGLVESTDNGTTWKGLVGIPQNSDFPSLDFLAETSTGYIFTGSLLTGALMRIAPDLKSGEVISANVRTIVVAPDNTLYLVLFNGLVYRSVDNGANWTDITRAPLAGNYAIKIAVGASGILYCAAKGGLYRSADHGTTWKLAGWEGDYVSFVAVDDSERLYVGVRESGIYVAETAVVHVDDSVVNPRLQIAPNPATESAVLHMSLDHATHVRITLHDAAGSSTATFLDEYREAGDCTVEIDLSKMAAGSYRVVVHAGTATSSHSLVVIH